MPARQLTLLMLVALVLLAPTVVFGQREDFVELEKVEVEELANAVRLRLTVDGVLQVNASTYWAYGRTLWGLLSGVSDEPEAGPDRRISFMLPNVRSGAAPAVQVAKYPVSHLEFSLVPWGQDNMLICTLVLYRPGYLTVIDTGGWPQDLSYEQEYDGPQVMLQTTRKQNELLITVLSDRPKEPPPERPVVEPAAAELEVTGEADNLSIHAINADMHLLLERVSRLAQVQVYLDDKVDLQVTAHLDSVPLERFLQTLMVGYGLSLHREGGAYFVSLSQVATAVPFWAAETRSVPLQYLSAVEAVLLLPDVLLSYVRSNEEGNALVMNGPSPLLDRIEQDLRVIDQPAYHCRLRAWVVSGRDVTERLQEITGRASGGTTVWQADSIGQVRIEVAERRAHELVSTLRLLATRRQLHMEALPVVQVKNGQRTRLFVGEKIYWVQQSGLASVEAGAALEIEPCTGGEWITASVRVNSSFLGETNDLGPLVLRRSAEGTVRLRSGDTVIIGGLRLSQATKDRRKTGVVPTGRSDVEEEQDVCVLLQARASLAPLKYEDNAREVVP